MKELIRWKSSGYNYMLHKYKQSIRIPDTNTMQKRTWVQICILLPRSAIIREIGRGVSWPYLELRQKIGSYVVLAFELEHYSWRNLLEALVTHPPRDRSGISSEAGDGHANMVVDG